MREWLADAWWDLRILWRDVCDAPWTVVQLIGVITLFVMFQFAAVHIGQNIRDFGRDMHVIAEEIRNSDQEGSHATP